MQGSTVKQTLGIFFKRPHHACSGIINRNIPVAQLCGRHFSSLTCLTFASSVNHRKDDMKHCSVLTGGKHNKRWTENVLQRTSYNTLNVNHARNLLERSVENPGGCLATLNDDRMFSTQAMVDNAHPKVKPYLKLIRLDKPIGTFLLFWPCTWSISLAAQAGHLPDLYLLALFGMGSFIMRGAGCIINDMWDKDFDSKVERTKTRPLASGELSQLQALGFLAVNLSVALTILLQLNWFTVFVGASSMFLVVAYPLAKRFTYWPQAMLGLTFNFGALLGWCAVWGRVDLPILPLYIAGFCWTLVYDTIYAHQDKYYDMLIGVRSTALKFGDQTKPWLAGFGSVMISCLTLSGYMCDQTWPYYAAVAATAAHLTHQTYTVDLNNPDDCMSKFKSNTQLGAVMFVGIVLGTLLKKKKDKENEQIDTNT